jgi:hypothetical protein
MHKIVLADWRDQLAVVECIFEFGSWRHVRTFSNINNSGAVEFKLSPSISIMALSELSYSSRGRAGRRGRRGGGSIPERIL